jgi:hypothetical protein
LLSHCRLSLQSLLSIGAEAKERIWGSKTDFFLLRWVYGVTIGVGDNGSEKQQG